MNKGLSITYSTFGCTLSGPGDFVVFSLRSNFLISSCENGSSVAISLFLFSIFGKLFTSWSVNTLLKKIARISALSPSLLAMKVPDSDLSCNSDTPVLVFLFEFTNFQKFLLFVLADSATCFSLSFQSLGVNRLTLFRALHYSLCFSLLLSSMYLSHSRCFLLMFWTDTIIIGAYLSWFMFNTLR